MIIAAPASSARLARSTAEMAAGHDDRDTARDMVERDREKCIPFVIS
jgi:hypothetical protein